jgi:serine/threonine protein kinase
LPVDKQAPCFYNFRTRRSPFESETLDGLFDRISRADRDPAPEYLSPTEAKLLDGLLEKDPDARLTVGDLLEDPYLSHYALHEERQTQFRNRTPREKLSKRGSLRGGFAGNSPLARGDGKEESPQLEKAPSETISELATLQSENATPPP